MPFEMIKKSCCDNEERRARDWSIKNPWRWCGINNLQPKDMFLIQRKKRFTIYEKSDFGGFDNGMFMRVLSKYNYEWAQAAESNQAEEVDGSLPRNVFPNKTVGPHYTLMSLKTPHCTSIFSSGPIMRSHPLPPSQLLSFSSTHLIITISSFFTISLVGKSFLWCAVSSHLWKVQRQFF